MNNYLLLLLLLSMNKDKGVKQAKNRFLSKVPDVSGKTEEEAEEMIKNVDLEPVSQFSNIKGGDKADVGRVIIQDPKPDQYVKPGTKVSFTVSLGEVATAPEINACSEIEDKIEAAKVEIIDRIEEKCSMREEGIGA